ncbi:MAG TPA: hypothetical protein DEF01_03715 [Gemmatimonadetes bacterium]|nr:hypothetical protein [Gemmatimonadota bacterium]
MGRTAVVDGYVTGANVFVDFNFNLQQDEGEPSAIFNADSSVYEFPMPHPDSTGTVPDSVSYVDFSAVEEFTLGCLWNRPRIAEVPAGAIDSSRGVVEEPYTMIYVPWTENNPGDKANITPFSTLLEAYIAEETEEIPEPISVADGCGQVAEGVAQDVSGRITELASDLAQYGYDPAALYEDFIAAEDDEARATAERVVDILTTVRSIQLMAEDEVGERVNQYVSRRMIPVVLSGDFETLEFDVSYQTISRPEDESFDVKDWWAYDAIILDDGQLVARDDGRALELSMDNLKEHAEQYTEVTSFMARDFPVTDVNTELEERHSWIWRDGARGIGELWTRVMIGGALPGDSTVAPDVSVGRELSITAGAADGIYSGEDQRTMSYHSWNWNGDQIGEGTRTYVAINNPSNEWMDYDILTVYADRDLSTINEIYGDLLELPVGLSSVAELKSLLTLSDWFNIEKITSDRIFVYYVRLSEDTGEFVEYCTVHERTELGRTGEELERVDGSTALARCTELFSG